MTAFDDCLPTLFCLHYLGGSGQEFNAMQLAIRQSARVVPIDLPGFGEAAVNANFSVSEMAQHVATSIGNTGPRWGLVGHSMGAKVAAVLASWAECGAVSLSPPDRLILIAASPLSPEPMQDSKRASMLGWFQGEPDAREAEALEYISHNVSAPLEPPRLSQAVFDLKRMNRRAWEAWLEHGSREDWSDRVAILKTPTLIIAGADDRDLGVTAQREHSVPHFAHCELHEVKSSKHLLPLEAPDEVAQLIARHL